MYFGQYVGANPLKLPDTVEEKFTSMRIIKFEAPFEAPTCWPYLLRLRSRFIPSG